MKTSAFGIKKRRVSRKPSGAAQISEFGAAFVIFMFFMVLPAVFVMRLAIALAVGQYATDRAAFSAATSAAYDLAIDNSQKQLHLIAKESIGAVAGLSPCAGLKGQGVDLFVIVQDNKKSEEVVYGPNLPLHQTIDQQNCRYFYHVNSHMKLPPLFASDCCGGWPASSLSFLTAPLVLNFSASRLCENPQSLRIQTKCMKFVTLNRSAVNAS